MLRPGSPFVAELPSRAWLESITEVDAGDARIARTAPGRAVHEDRIARVAIEAVIPSDAEWVAAFAPWFDARCEPLGASETLLVARRR